MERIRDTFEDDIKSEFLDYWKDNKDGDETNEEIRDRFIEEEYNTSYMTKYECMNFINNNLGIYLEMEQVCLDFYESELGDVWTGRGVVSVVTLWQYICADNFLRDNYDAIIKDYEGVPIYDDIPYAPAPPAPVAPEADIEEETSAPAA
jgi:hypothetical protein